MFITRFITIFELFFFIFFLLYPLLYEMMMVVPGIPLVFWCWAWILVFMHITLFWSFVSFLIHVSNCVFDCSLQCLKRLLLLLVCYLVTVLFFFFLLYALYHLDVWFFKLIFISNYKGDHVLCFFQPQFKEKKSHIWFCSFVSSFVVKDNSKQLYYSCEFYSPAVYWHYLFILIKIC